MEPVLSYVKEILDKRGVTASFTAREAAEAIHQHQDGDMRSEERRVGKEC